MPCPTGSCDAPAGTAAVNIKRRRATLTWDAVPDAISYTVQFRVLGATTWGSEATTSETSITASSLSNGTSYEWHVRSNCNGTQSAYSGICSFTAGQSNSSSCAGERGVLAGVSVYPNPAGSMVRIEAEMNGEAPVTITLTDALGRVALIRQLGADLALDLDVSDLEAGLYLVRATNGTEEQVIRLMVE